MLTQVWTIDSARVPFRYNTTPNEEQRTAAADLIDEGAQLAQKLDRNKFARSCVLALALNETGQVVGAGAVKEPKGSIAELGYLVVHPDYHRRGIAHELTRLRIAAATEAGLELLFTNVYRDNDASLGNLRKAGFPFWGDFLSAYGTGRVISWYYYPLRPAVSSELHMGKLTRMLKRA